LFIPPNNAVNRPMFAASGMVPRGFAIA
jgi:hypothetical protein